MKNRNLDKAKKAKNDEFYTQLSDIENELFHYQNHFKGKVVYCNCDDPRVSNFTRFFVDNFKTLGLKKLISSCYKRFDLFHNTEHGGYSIYDGATDSGFIPFKGDGDFRSEECIELLKRADIVVTNPPFSLFREYVAQLVKYDKKFVIIGNKNSITYKEIFLLLKDKKIWLGYGFRNGDCYMKTDNQEMVNLRNSSWYTNLKTKKQYKNISPEKCYIGNESHFFKYDNYDAIDISSYKDFPQDYKGKMGVPITFFEKCNPDLFEVIDILRPILHGKAIYRRIIIQSKHEAKKTHIPTRDDHLNNSGVYSLADHSDNIFPAFRDHCNVGG